MKRLACFLACLLFLLPAGCAGASPSPLADFAPPESRRLTVYTSHKEEVYLPIVREFEARTGIWVEVVSGGTNELLKKIESEAKAPRCDVMFGGGGESLLANAALFEPYACGEAEALGEGLRPEGDLYTPFSSLPVVLVCNPRMVPAGEIAGWADLLDEDLRGEIAFADPRVSGSGYTALMTMLQALPGEDEEELERFFRNLDGTVLPDSGDVIETVALGRLSVGVTLEQSALQALAAGEQLSLVYPREGTSALPDGTALVAGAPHRENACAFIEFTLGADVQNMAAQRLFRRPVRADVPDRADLPARGAFPLLEYDAAGASARKEDVLGRWEQLSREAGL